MPHSIPSCHKTLVPLIASEKINNRADILVLLSGLFSMFSQKKFNFEAFLEEIHSWTYLSTQYAYWPY